VVQNTRLLCLTLISFLKQVGLDANPLVYKIQINALTGWAGRERKGVHIARSTEDKLSVL